MEFLLAVSGIRLVFRYCPLIVEVLSLSGSLSLWIYDWICFFFSFDCVLIMLHVFSLFQRQLLSCLALSYLLKSNFSCACVPSEGPFSKFYFAIGAKTLSQSCAHLCRLQVSTTTSASPSSFVPHCSDPSPSIPPHSLSPLDPSFAASFSLFGPD